MSGAANSLYGFQHNRSIGEIITPTLPPGYSWEEVLDPMQPDRKIDVIRRYCPEADWVRRLSRERSAVFCHRGFYDRAVKIPENSAAAVANGVARRLILHGLDARMGPRSGQGQTFIAHDESAKRTTSRPDRWSKLSIREIFKTLLVNRRFDPNKDDFASSYENTNETVVNLEELMARYNDMYSWEPKVDPALWQLSEFCTFQIDLRGNDFARAIVWFLQMDLRLDGMLVMLKGYNLTFPDGSSLEASVRSVAREEFGQAFDWQNIDPQKLPLIVVFYSQLIIDLALREKNKNPAKMKDEEKLLFGYEKLNFNHLVDVTRRHVMSFVELGGPRANLFIPEIVHSGLGLGYDSLSNTAVNPLNGTPIEDLAVIFMSRLDRAMIEVSLELKKSGKLLSGCTRLCDVRTSGGLEFTASMKDGKLRPKPAGERGLPAKLRSIHGGLYPRSNLVVADDPLSEIAARTWIDDYAKLDWSKLLDPRVTYEDWLRSAGDEFYEAVQKLQGPFLPNTFSGPLHHLDIQADT